MADFSYTTVPGKLTGLMEKIRSAGVPTKASGQWLKSIGFTSSNDASLVGVLKQIGFVDGSGVPTDVWKKYRGTNHKHVLADAIRTGYSALFSVYEDADSRSQQELENVFRSTSTAGSQVIGKATVTFRNLCALADFSGSHAHVAAVHAADPLHHPVKNQPVHQGGQMAQDPSSPSVHIDIQVHISPESSPEQIDQIFASMAKHLYGKAVT